MKIIRSHSCHRGSALLIVLGMLSFMVVSAVAFSAYMRSSRLPSSYLRRAVASRLLVKAALAEAMERLDFAIADNPYPGVGNEECVSGERERYIEDAGDEVDDYRNYFYHNVFVGRENNPWVDGGASNTVATLTLEGLAYLPPPLVNDVRRYSRLSPTAQWHKLPFDSGRYAYTVVDVSDCFDINRLKADTRRDSGANRISLAYLFENDTHTGYKTKPADWDKFIKKVADTNPKVPLISVADMNLALNQYDSVLPHPFADYIGSNDSEFYGSGDESKIKSLMMVTDSYFPAGAVTNDLANPQYQPVSPLSPSTGFMDAFDGSLAAETFEKRLSNFDLINLKDYLDEDDEPSSLAMPTVEQNPMVVRIEPTGNFALGLDSKSNTTDLDEVWQEKTTEYYVKSIINGDLALTLTLVYPFKYVDEPANYEVDAAVAVFLANTDRPYFRNSAIYPDYKVAELFKKQELGDEASVFRFISSPEQYKPKATITREEDAVKTDIILDIDTSKMGEWLADHPAFTITEKYKKEDETRTTVVDAKYNLLPVNERGAPLTDYNSGNAADIGKRIKEGDNTSKQDLYPCLAVVVRVKNKTTGKVVDLVPAGLGADNLNGNNEPESEGLDEVGARCPILTFWPKEPRSIRLNAPAFEDQPNGNADIKPAALFCGDPRYNHNPEDWAECDAGDKWLDKCGVGGSGCDPDIFMAVSNQGYLQSVYELAFLPQLMPKAFEPATSIAGRYKTPGTNDKEYGTPKNQALFWHTYQCFPSTPTATDQDDFEALGVTSGAGTYKINPYSARTGFLMAAFANTPCCWAFASTNLDANGFADSDLKAENFQEYAFSELPGATSDRQLKWKFLEEFARNFQDDLKTNKNKAWEDVWDMQDWNDENLGVANEEAGMTLHSIDRKFLYGYWRDSFANRQQLFLVFVRAEPMMMGGGVAGQTPPALGARAVALVWRDPTDRDGQPHRMRILFYRQFE